MLRRSIGVLFATALCAMPQSVWAADPPPIPDFAVDKALRPTDAMPEREIRWSHPHVTMTDVVYSTLPGFRALHLDLYRPTGIAAPRPLVVFAHGGAYAYANPRAGAAFYDFPSILAALATRGYTVASIEYRFTEEAPFPAPLEDLRAAIRFLRDNAARLGIDGTRVALWGMSAGAHLVAYNALNWVEGTCVQGLAGWFGLYDVVAADERDPGDIGLRAILHCGDARCAASELQTASPIDYVDRTDPPTLLVHGLEDTGPPPSQSERLAANLREAGVDTELVLIPDTTHGFIGKNDDVTKRALRQALTVTFDFFDRVLKGAPPQAPANR